MTQVEALVLVIEVGIVAAYCLIGIFRGRP